MHSSITPCRKVIIAASLAVFGLLGQSQSALGSNWTNTGATGNWSSASSWNSIPNAVGDAAFHAISNTTATTQDIGAGVTVGSIALTNNSNNSWTFTLTNPITLNNGGSGASISNTDTNTGTTNGLIFSSGAAGLVLADNLLVSNTGGSTRNGAIELSAPISGSGNVTFTSSANVVTGSSAYAGAIRVQTSTNTFTGNVLIKKGAVTYNLQSSFGNTANAIALGETGGQSVTLQNTAGLNGSTGIPYNITVASLTSGQTALLGSASVGNSEYKGNITLNGNLSITSAATGTAFLKFSTGVISGSGGITKIGVGPLRFDNNQTYSGPTIISTSSLQLGLGGTVGALNPLSSITNNANLTISRSNAVVQGTDFASGISGTGSFSHIGTGTTTLTGTNTFSGATTISAGALSVLSLNKVTGGTSSSSLGAPTTVANGTISLGSLGTSAALIYAGSGETTDRVIDLSSATAGTNINIIDQSGSAGLLKFASALTVTGALAHTLTLQGSNAGNGELAGAIVDNSGTNTTSLAKAGSNTWTLSAANSYTGGTAISGGTLALSGSGTTGTTAGAVTLSGGALDMGGTSRTVGAVSITGAPASGDTLLNGTLTPSSISATNTTGNAILSANLIGSAALAKSGAGKLTLTGTDTFSGASTITGGTLVVNGSIVSNTAVSNTATLGGSGTISGTVTISNATLAPGNSPGTITVSNTLSLASTSSLQYDLLGTDTTVGSNINDLTTGVTNLTLDGTLNVTEVTANSFLSAVNGNSWRLINYSGSLTDNGLALGTMPTLASGLNFTIDTSITGQVNLSVVPEPTTVAIIGLSFGALLRRRREI